MEHLTVSPDYEVDSFRVKPQNPDGSYNSKGYLCVKGSFGPLLLGRAIPVDNRLLLPSSCFLSVRPQLPFHDRQCQQSTCIQFSVTTTLSFSLILLFMTAPQHSIFSGLSKCFGLLFTNVLLRGATKGLKL